MASPSLTVRLIAELIPDTGADPSCELDTGVSTPLVLDGFDQWTQHRVTVAPGAADQAVTFTAAIAILVFSDQPISIRLAAAETLVANTRLFAIVADDEVDEVHSTSILLTGNGSTEANVSVWILEKP